MIEFEELTPLEQQFDSYFRRNFSRLLEPDLIVALKRFLAKGRRNAGFSVSVGVAAVQVVPFDPNRVMLWLYNLGSAIVYVGTPKKVTAGPIGDPNAGMPIQPSTGMIIEANVGELWAISGTPAQDLRVWDISAAAP